ncbi:hypothetical protein [uncultured Litoreibacter sp.]|uniref:hypothetical protein n=1 Tax=uncultured Litoreibacter sp. TaxID=1392394 RepID=UPI002605C1BD|nr:hypothetical protein [uncultured Litoreibacter sp.]
MGNLTFAEEDYKPITVVTIHEKAASTPTASQDPTLWALGALVLLVAAFAWLHSKREQG